MEYTLRLATPDDAPAIARHRCKMFREMEVLADAGYDELLPASEVYFRDCIAAGTYRSWLVVFDSVIVAGGGMQIGQVAPRPGPDKGMVPGGLEGLIMNVYVEPEHRRQGLANRLMRTMIYWGKENGMRSLILRASYMGEPLYEKLGFERTTEMRLFT